MTSNHPGSQRNDRALLSLVLVSTPYLLHGRVLLLCCYCAIAIVDGGVSANTCKRARRDEPHRRFWIRFPAPLKQGVPPEQAAYVAALRACAKGAEWQRGTQLLDDYLQVRCIISYPHAMTVGNHLSP